jgi:hypothetical protein
MKRTLATFALALFMSVFAGTALAGFCSDNYASCNENADRNFDPATDTEMNILAKQLCITQYQQCKLVIGD